MTTTTQQRTIIDALFIEPIELVISQPHQALISSASIYLIAAEAGVLVGWPYNVLMAIGAEWAYLRGFSSGQHVTTPWAARLNWSAVTLVIMYGSLWGLRQFGAIPEQPPVWGAVVLTLVHILCIGSVTLCSAMTHSAMVHAERNRNQEKVAVAEKRNQRLQEAEDELRLEMARKEAELAAWEKARVASARVAAEIAQLKQSNRSASTPQPRQRSVVVDGVEYSSIQAAADAHGITRQAMSKRLRKNQ